MQTHEIAVASVEVIRKEITSNSGNGHTMNLGGNRINQAAGLTAAQRAELFALIREKSFGYGQERTLSSGKKSDFYFDMKPTMLHPDAVELLAGLICDRLQKEKVAFVGGLELGAIPLISPVVAEFKRRGFFVPGFLVRKRVKEHGTKKLLEGVGSLTAKCVAILDDVTTSGKSAMDAVNVVRDNGAEVSIVLSVVDREEGAAEFYRENGIAFDSLFKASEFLAVRTASANIPSTRG